MQSPHIKSFEDVYYPREDSYLLAKVVEEYAHGRVIDIGTGSGIQGITAALKCCNVTFTDVDKNAIDSAKENCKLNKVNGIFKLSNMFDSVTGKFDTIIFNPPYLPVEEVNGEKAFDGGKDGRKFMNIFLKEYNSYLKKDGIALLLESSFNGWENDVKNHKAELVAKSHYFFEDLVVLLLR